MSEREPLEVTIYQIVADDTLKKNRTDGCGWELQWAEFQRDWMENTSSKFAYRCLPLTIANQLGFWVTNPIGFSAKWLGQPDKVEFKFDAHGDFWKACISNHFAYGIVTWNTPFLFRTKPAGSRMLITGPPNRFKHNAQALSGLIETDWMSMSFTMNWQLLKANEEVRFERGEPIFQAIPLARNPCLDLEQATVVYRRLDDDPEVASEYRTWVESRAHFHKLQKEGAVSQDDWQKHYFRGVTLDGSEAPTLHHTKIKFPEIKIATGAPPPPAPSRPPVGAAFKVESGPKKKPAAAPAEKYEKVEPVAKVEAAPKLEEGRNGELKLRVYRAHPRAARIAAAEPTLAGDARAADLRRGGPIARANALGWWVFAPCDLDATWRGGRSFDREVLSAYGDEDAEVVRALGAAGPAYQPAKKIAFGDDGEGVLTLWTGLVVETPPNWAVEVRSPINVEWAPFVRVREELLETDRAPRDVSLKIRFLETGRRLELRAGALWPPIAQLVPVRREAYQEDWKLGQFALAKPVATVYENWMRGRDEP